MQVPLRSKNQWSLMVRELLGFAGILGHAEMVFMCDNEPSYCSCSEWWSMQDSAWVCLRGKTIQHHTAMEILLLKMQLDAFDLWQVR